MKDTMIDVPFIVVVFWCGLSSAHKDPENWWKSGLVFTFSLILLAYATYLWRGRSDKL